MGKEHIHYSQGNNLKFLGNSGAVGGNFLVEKQELYHDSSCDIPYITTPYQPPAAWQRFIGKLYAIGDVGVGDFPSPFISSSSELDAFGTTAIANVEPTNPISNLLGALGEIKSEGIPLTPAIHSWRPRTWTAKNAGSEYLNVEFGWKPLISDIRKTANAITHSDKLVQQYSRNSGRKIKRAMTLPGSTEVISQTKTVGGVYPTPSIGPPFSEAPMEREITETKFSRRWFEGCFTYYLPPFDPDGHNFKRNRQIANYLYGARVDPELVWNLTPWTWAIDWLGNFGDVLHNVGAFRDNGLVMQYGYVMDTTIHDVTTTISNIKYYSIPDTTFSCSTTLRTTVKQRRTATPYGFGLDVSSFSDRQKAILIALGFSRA